MKRKGVGEGNRQDCVLMCCAISQERVKDVMALLSVPDHRRGGKERVGELKEMSFIALTVFQWWCERKEYSSVNKYYAHHRGLCFLLFCDPSLSKCAFLTIPYKTAIQSQYPSHTLHADPMSVFQV